MTNIAYIVIYAVLVVLSATIIVLTLRKKKRTKLDGGLIFIAAMLLGWSAALLAFFSSVDFELSRYLYDLKLPFVAFVSMSWFLYIINFYGVERLFPAPVIAALFVIPLFTLLLALTTPYHDFIRSELIITQTVPVHEYTMQRGSWFWFHSIFCYLLVVAAFSIAVVQHRKVPKEYRRPSTLLVSGIVVSFVGNIAVIMLNVDIDLSLVAASLTAIILYQAMRSYQGFSFFIQARNEAFNHIEDAIFILDSKEGIINMNRSAYLWLEAMAIPSEQVSFVKIEEAAAAQAEERIEIEEEENGVDYCLANGTVYNIKKKPIKDNEGTAIGYFASVSDETGNRELIEHLDKHSGLDALTGLSNRRKLEEDLMILDCPASYPLAIIVGDLNNLKETNDLYGHQQGDVLLRLAAESLRSVCPPTTRIGRVGGDEFIVILPNHNEGQVAEIAYAIRAYLERENARYPFTPSIALGSAIKHASDQDVQQIIDIADSIMYSEKQRMKGGLEEGLEEWRAPLSSV